MRKDEIVSRTEKPEYDREMEETVHQEVTGGQRKRKTVGGGRWE